MKRIWLYVTLLPLAIAAGWAYGRLQVKCWWYGIPLAEVRRLRRLRELTGRPLLDGATKRHPDSDW